MKPYISEAGLVYTDDSPSRANYTRTEQHENQTYIELTGEETVTVRCGYRKVFEKEHMYPVHRLQYVYGCIQEKYARKFNEKFRQHHAAKTVGHQSCNCNDDD